MEDEAGEETVDHHAEHLRDEQRRISHHIGKRASRNVTELEEEVSPRRTFRFDRRRTNECKFDGRGRRRLTVSRLELLIRIDEQIEQKISGIVPLLALISQRGEIGENFFRRTEINRRAVGQK